MSGRITSRSRFLALAVLAAVFVAGALAGAALDRVSGGTAMTGFKERTLERRGSESRAATIFAPDGPLGERLQLTAEQRLQVEEILAEHGQDADVVLREMRPRLQAIFERTTENVRAALDPAQQEELDRFLDERRETLRKRYQGHDRHRPRPGEPAPGES